MSIKQGSPRRSRRPAPKKKSAQKPRRVRCANCVLCGGCAGLLLKKH